MSWAGQDERVEPPSNGTEKETLEAFLDYHRDTLLMKCEGLSDEELRRPMVVSGTSMLGVVKHLGYVERWWFQEVFAAESTEFLRRSDDRDAEFRIEESDSTESVIEFYKQECNKSRAIVASAKPEDIAKHSNSERSLRWILVHMIEETCRHNGHVDILREMIDGRTGE